MQVFGGDLGGGGGAFAAAASVELEEAGAGVACDPLPQPCVDHFRR